MNKILHVIASPRGVSSRTLGLSAVLIEKIRARYPEAVIDELDLFSVKLPDLFGETVRGKYALMGGKDLPDDLKPLWADIVNHINRFLAADTIIISSPMWNFGIPYKLKHYIDVIFQPKYLFKYTPTGAVGLAAGKKMFIVTSRGGDYSPESPSHAFDLQEPYLRNAFGFVGITDVKFINAQPMDMGPEIMHKKFDETAQIIKNMEI